MFLLFVFALGIACSSYSQPYFEGEINYRLETVKKDPSFDAGSLRAAGATTSACVFKNGDYIARPSAGSLEYYYFNHTSNRVYSKFKSADTLFFEPGDEPMPSQDSVYTIEMQYNTDSILGYICNRLILRSKSLKLTIVYSPDLAVDPSWYKNTKHAYYDVIYSHTRSLFLKSISEFDQFVSILTAYEVVPRMVKKEEFPDIKL